MFVVTIQGADADIYDSDKSRHYQFFYLRISVAGDPVADDIKC